MSQPQAFKCPSCSASLDYDGTAEVVTCAYCGTTLLVPDEWRREPSRVDYSQNDAGNIHEILELTRAGRKIEAIKLYRETFGVGLKEAKEAVEQLEQGQPTAVYVTTTSIGTVGAATAGAGGCGCVSPLFVILILVVVFGALFYLSNPARGDRIISDLTAGEFDEAIAQLDQVVSNINKATFESPRLAGGNTSADRPDLLLQTWAYGGNEIPVSLSYTTVVSDQRRVSWEVPLGVSGDYNHAFGFSDQTLYVAQGTALHAYDKKDGAPLWETVLSDSVQNGCETCIQATREQVVVMTADNKLEAFDAQNGRSLWQWALTGETFVRPDTGYQAFVLAGAQVIFIDNLPDGRASDKGLFVLDVASGAQLQLLAPNCPDPQQFFDDDYLGFDSQVIIDPTQNTAVFLFGSAIIDQLCLQKWDIASGSQLWGSRLPADVRPASLSESGLLLAGSHTPFITHTPDTLFVALNAPDSGNNTAVYTLSLADGSLVAQHATADYSLYPVGQQADTLLIRAVRERGTKQAELWGVAPTLPAEEGRRWRHVITAEYLFEQDPFDDRYSYRLVPDGLVLLQVFTDSEPAQLNVVKLDPATGDLLYETDTALSRDQWRGLLWTDSAAYLANYDLWRVDLSDGTAVVDWP